jgi:hypothetical protein
MPYNFAVLSSRDRWLIAADEFARSLRRAAMLCKFRPDQPRAPAGNPNGGQWTSGNITTVGGFAPEDMDKTVQSFVSENCKAYIYEVLPGQFLDMSIADVTELGNSGDAPARRCLKLLKQNEYRKRK